MARAVLPALHRTKQALCHLGKRVISTRPLPLLSLDISMFNSKLLFMKSRYILASDMYAA